MSLDPDDHPCRQRRAVIEQVLSIFLLLLEQNRLLPCFIIKSAMAARRTKSFAPSRAMPPPHRCLSLHGH